MALHNTRGKEGESLAVNFLQRKDFEIFACNWRHQHCEIDIIAFKNDIIHFIEVKTRHNLTFGYPEEAVSKKKFDNMKRGAEHFMRQYPLRKRLQFDILAITRSKNKKEEFFFIEDVYI